MSGDMHRFNTGAAAPGEITRRDMLIFTQKPSDMTIMYLLFRDFTRRDVERVCRSRDSDVTVAEAGDWSLCIGWTP